MNTTERNLRQYIDHTVIDQAGTKVGKLHSLWADPDGEPRYLGVQTGWLFGKTHVVPAQRVEVNESSQTIRLPYSADKIKDAPSYDPNCEIDAQSEREILAYYGIGSRRSSQAATESQPQATTEEHPTGQEGATVQLHEEQIKVGKRQVEAGGVRLRKIIRTETVNQPVELQREEIVVERVPGNQPAQPREPGSKEYQQQDIFIPLRREEAVVEKETRVREEVRVSKKSETERQTVSGQVRKEDVQIQRSDTPPAGSKTRATQPAGQKTRKGERGKTAVFCLVRDRQQASRIVEDLKAAGFSKNDISALFPDKSGTKDFAHEKNTKAPEGATTGAGTGAIAGGIFGWLVGVGALAIPGLGPFIAAGPLAATLSGAAVGGAAGGLIGALVGLGIPEYEAKRYEGKLREGNILLSVHADNSDETRRAKEIFERDGADEISSSTEEKVTVRTE